MTVSRKVWLAPLLGLMLVGLLVTFAGAVVLSEGAIHPILKRPASDTAALARSIAHAAGATARHVSITTQDGVKLDAWWLSSLQSSGRAVIVCHGVGDSAFGGLGFALLFLHHGYSVLVPDSRGSGQSGGFVTYGVLESGDIQQWLTWMKGQGITESYGLGESLGAAILIQSLAKGATFKAIVAECHYSSFEAIAEERVGRVLPSPLAMLLVKEGIFYLHLRYRVNLHTAHTDIAIVRIHTPVLLIHGTADKETSPANSIRLAQLNPRWTTLWLVPGAKHTGAYAADPQAFETRVVARFGN